MVTRSLQHKNSERMNNFNIQIEFTLQDFKNMQNVLIKVEDTINAYPEKISLAVVDHIISVPGIVMPVDSLA